MDGCGELARKPQVRRAGLDPNEVAVGRVGKATGDDRIQSVAYPEESFRGALAGGELRVDRVDVAGQQVGRECVGAGNDDAGNAHDVCGQTGRVQCANVLRRGDEHLATEVAALLFRRELVLPVHTGRTGRDHALHQFEGVE